MQRLTSKSLSEQIWSALGFAWWTFFTFNVGALVALGNGQTRSGSNVRLLTGDALIVGMFLVAAMILTLIDRHRLKKQLDKTNEVPV